MSETVGASAQRSSGQRVEHMSDSRKRRKRLIRLWLLDYHCHWCRCPTVLIKRPPEVEHKHMPPRADEATLDHLRTRYDQRTHVTDGTEVTVLACWQCNHRRGAEREALVPLEELRRRADNQHRRGGKYGR